MGSSPYIFNRTGLATQKEEVSLRTRLSMLLADVPPIPDYNNQHNIEINELIELWLAQPAGDREKGVLELLSKHWDQAQPHLFTWHVDRIGPILKEYESDVSAAKSMADVAVAAYKATVGR